MAAPHEVPGQEFLHNVPALSGLSGGSCGHGGGRAGLCWAGCRVFHSRVLCFLAISKCVQANLLLCFYWVCFLHRTALGYVRPTQNISRKQIYRSFLIYFIANASVQQEHAPLLLHAVILASNVVMVSEHVPVKVELMVMVSQLVAMLVLQLAKVDPWEAALEADLTRTQISWKKKIPFPHL